MTADQPPDRLTLRLLAGSVLTGIAAGIGGVLLTLLLHGIQHLAFGYTENTFLIGVLHASPGRRLLAMTVGGLLVGVGWWALRRWRPPPVLPSPLGGRAMPELPITPVAADAVLQIAAVGFGASLGREGAPRQIGAAFGVLLGRLLRLGAAHRRTLLACGAGAGLAAVYNVPLGGAVFTLEVLLRSAAPRHLLPAAVSAAVAAVLAWPVLGNVPVYQVVPVRFQLPVLVLALVLGPVAGVVATGFRRITGLARRRPPVGWRLPVATTLAFAAVGAMAIPFPQLLGNGKGPAQLALDGTAVLWLLAALVVLKPLATAICLGSGATGGLLTPAVATGAALGALAGGLWSMVWPGGQVAAYAMAGAAAVLAVTMRAPLCAVVLVVEFTHTGFAALPAVLIAVAGAVLVDRLRKARRAPGRVATSEPAGQT